MSHVEPAKGCALFWTAHLTGFVSGFVLAWYSYHFLGVPCAHPHIHIFAQPSQPHSPTDTGKQQLDLSPHYLHKVQANCAPENLFKHETHQKEHRSPDCVHKQWFIVVLSLTPDLLSVDHCQCGAAWGYSKTLSGHMREIFRVMQQDLKEQAECDCVLRMCVHFYACFCHNSLTLAPTLSWGPLMCSYCSTLRTKLKPFSTPATEVQEEQKWRCKYWRTTQKSVPCGWELLSVSRECNGRDSYLRGKQFVTKLKLLFLSTGHIYLFGWPQALLLDWRCNRPPDQSRWWWNLQRCYTAGSARNIWQKCVK